MSFVAQAVTLVSEPPGSFAYHLLTLFALEATLAMALGHYRLTRDAGTRRLALAAAMAIAMRGVLLAIAALGAMGLVYYDAAMPPIDRAASLATFLMIGWALNSRSDKRVADGVFGGGIILVFVAAIVGLLIWHPDAVLGASYNSTLAHKMWQTAQLGTLAAMIGFVVWKQPHDWGLAIGLFSLPALASLAQLYQSMTYSILSGHIAAFNRFAELAALPILALIVYRQVIGGLIKTPIRPDETLPGPISELRDEGEANVRVSALQARLERLQQEWDQLEERLEN